MSMSINGNSDLRLSCYNQLAGYDAFTRLHLLKKKLEKAEE